MKNAETEQSSTEVEDAKEVIASANADDVVEIANALADRIENNS